MFVRQLIIAGTILAAAPALAQAPNAPAPGVQPANAAQNAAMWDVFLKLYPKRALQAREEGAVGFRVTLDAKGDVTDCQVTKSSGHPLLDQETCKLVTLNAVFKPDPNLSGSQTKTSDGTINWRLPDSKAALNAPQAIASAEAPGKVICKKAVVTGTVASVERTCMTQREWNRQSDDAKQTWEEMQGSKGSTHGN